MKRCFSLTAMFVFFACIDTCMQPAFGQDYRRPSIEEQRSTQRQKNITKPPVFADSLRLVTCLQRIAHDSMEGRLTGTQGNFKTQRLILGRLAALNIQAWPAWPAKTQSFTISKGGSSMDGTNIIGYIPGSLSKDSFLVISAHYDHIGIRNNLVFNGADDNASGVAVLLEAAAYFREHPPRHSILLCFFDAEEQGIRGSRHFVGHLPESIKTTQILLNINMDMLSRYNAEKELFACGTSHYQYLYKPLLKVGMRHQIALMFGHDGETELPRRDDWTFQSDHGAFHEKGIPFVYLGVEDHPDYHRNTDDFEKIDPAFFYGAANLAIDVMVTLDAALPQTNRQHK